MTGNFPASLTLTLRYEGGYSNIKGDAGGATNMGVTQATDDAWRKAHGLPTHDVKGLTQDEVAAIYKQNYWDKCHCDELPHPLDIAVMDAAVNSGPGQSIKWMQKALGVDADGGIGPHTLAAATACDGVAVAKAVIDEREAFDRWLAANKGDQQFLAGWLHRLTDLRKVCGIV